MSEEPTGIKRVLAVSPDATRSGAAPWLRDLLRWAVDERGVTAEVILLEDGPLADPLAELGPLHLVPSGVVRLGSVADALHRPRWAHAVTRRWLRHAIAEVGPVDLVLAGSPATTAALVPHRRALAPIVTHVHEHGMGPATSTAGCLDGACLVVAPTAAVAEWAARPPGAGGLGVPRERVRLHAGPVEPPARHPRPDADGSALVVGCGPVGWRAGTDRFVALAAAVDQRLPDREVRFAWIGAPDGDGTDRDVLDEIAVRGLDELVHLQGDVADRADRLAAADVVVVTARDDPYPVAAVEAALAGTPVVGFRPGTALLAEAGHDDRRVDHLDVDGLADQVVDLVTAPDSGRLLAGDLARAAAAATTPLAAAALWSDIEDAVVAAREGAG